MQMERNQTFLMNFIFSGQFKSNSSFHMMRAYVFPLVFVDTDVSFSATTLCCYTNRIQIQFCLHLHFQWVLKMNGKFDEHIRRTEIKQDVYNQICQLLLLSVALRAERETHKIVGCFH